jgi:hypothetical protein
MPIDAHSGASHWRDLIDNVFELQQTYKVRRIMSDQVTTFILYAATRGEIMPFSLGRYFPKNNDHYRTDFINSDHSQSLLVINRRGGLRTLNTKLAQHWPDHILDTSALYPSDIDEYIEQSKMHLKLLWSSNSISVYLMPPWHSVYR